MYCFITDWAISWSNFNLSWIEFLWRALEGLNMFHWTWFDKSSFVCSVSFSILVSTGYHSTFLLNVRRTNTRSDWREKSTEKKLSKIEAINWGTNEAAPKTPRRLVDARSTWSQADDDSIETINQTVETRDWDGQRIRRLLAVMTPSRNGTRY